MRAADTLMESLKAEGVKDVFGIPGGANLPTYDAMVDADFRHVQVRHEQAGGHAAEGYAQASGRVGVAFATSGPGATNLVTAIADAMMDSVPTVFITGQVRTELLGTDGFQEADISGITMPIVKHSIMIQDPRDIPAAIHEAFHIARTGRPVLYVGGGVVNANASESLRELALSDRFPVTCTLMGLGAFPAPHEQWLGMLGMHGTRSANYAMDEADLIVAIGARF